MLAVPVAKYGIFIQIGVMPIVGVVDTSDAKGGVVSRHCAVGSMPFHAS